jgi:hypothetical protein
MVELMPPSVAADDAAASSAARAAVLKMEALHNEQVEARKVRSEKQKNSTNKPKPIVEADATDDEREEPDAKRACTSVGRGRGKGRGRGSGAKAAPKVAPTVAPEVATATAAKTAPKAAPKVAPKVAAAANKRPPCPPAYSQPTQYLGGKILMSYSKKAWRVFPDANDVKESSVGWGGTDAPSAAKLKETWAIACAKLETKKKK